MRRCFSAPQARHLTASACFRTIPTICSTGETMLETTVVVIGGGATGIGTLRDLCMRGVPA
ncbi:MAG TPA: hypothetical protein VEZ52_00905, partial [Desulfovibrio sp.]|uniref:hypothetical protein n=1 Tax=Desulfovibrio sp. TaxID=885 RepID=UPI002D351027